MLTGYPVLLLPLLSSHSRLDAPTSQNKHFLPDTGFATAMRKIANIWGKKPLSKDHQVLGRFKLEVLPIAWFLRVTESHQVLRAGPAPANVTRLICSQPHEPSAVDAGKTKGG